MAATLIRPSDIAKLAGLSSPAAVSNWRRREGLNFPDPVGGTPNRPLFDRDEVVAWLKQRDPERYAHLGKVLPEQIIFSFFESLRGVAEVSAIVDFCLLGLCLRKTALEVPAFLETWRSAEPTIEGVYGLAATAFEQTGSKVFAPDEDIFQSRIAGSRGAAQLFEGFGALGADDLVGIANAILTRGTRAYARGGGESGSVESPMSHFLASLAVGRVLEDAPESQIRDAITPVIEMLGLGPIAKGEVHDPACGIAEVLVRIGRVVPGVRLTGTDIVRRNVWRTRVRFYLEGLEGEIINADSLSESQAVQGCANLVVEEPPFAMAVRVSATDPRWLYGEPEARDGFAGWLQDALYRLVPGGRALVTSPVGNAMRSNRMNLEFRRRLVASGRILAIIAMPQRLYQNTSIATLVWVLGDEGERDRVSFIDLAAWAESDDRTEIPAADVELAEILKDSTANLVPATWIRTADVDAGEVRARYEAAMAEAVEALADVSGVLEDPMMIEGAARISTVDELARSGGVRLVKTLSRRASDSNEYTVKPSDLVRGVLVTESADEAGEDTTQPGDILMSTVSGVRAGVDLTGGHTVSATMTVLRVDPEVFDPAYVAACLEGEWNARFVQGTAIAHVRPGALEIPLLPLDGQRAFLAQDRRLRSALAEVEAAGAALEAARSAALMALRFGAGE